jgi:LysR family transcriptional regulator, hydrogen peroxide-inducible genes activator
MTLQREVAMISIKQLRYFCAIARFGHFGKAAEQCNVTQPALSMQVREFENELGLPLLERRAQGVQLTDAGREIAERANRILASIRDLDDYARHRDSVLCGGLRLGVIPSIAPYILPPLLPRIRRDYPDLELQIRETQTETLIGELVGGELDLILLALPVTHADVTTLALFDDHFLLAAPKGWRPKGRVRKASPELLANGRLLLLEEGHCLREQALAVCNFRQVDNVDTFGASSLSTIVQMVGNGMGLTLLPEISLDVETRHGDFELMRFEPPEPYRTVGLAWRTTSPRRRDFEVLGTVIRETAPTPTPTPKRTAAATVRSARAHRARGPA